VEEVFPFATASLRNIENTDEVLSAIRAESGFSIRVLSGTEEAVFDYYGAIHSVALESGLLVDIGGGSTELVFYQERQVVSTASLPIGSLNLYNRFVGGILPTQWEAAQIAAETLRQLQTIRLPEYPLSFQPICGVGGTARTIRKLLEDQKVLTRGEAAYPCEALEVLLQQLTKDTRGIAKQVLKVEPERIHTLFPGAIILAGVAKHYGSYSVVTSKYGVREGYLYYLLEERGLLGG
jgi:exopolyphosphatase/guanosine-5'-triphosphate,3'-diphosphate pyrophosphatase